jgi:hypothetical protein
MQTFTLKGFTKDTTPGVGKGTAPGNCILPTHVLLQGKDWAVESDKDADGLSDDDKLAGEVDKVVDYISAA